MLKLSENEVDRMVIGFTTTYAIGAYRDNATLLSFN
jgi:hypothetical protein